MTDYSVILPAHNEAEALPDLLNELFGVMESLGAAYEIVVVDDGSTDSTLPVLRDLQRGWKPLRVLSLDRNWGQSAALDAGFRAATGRLLITLDADGQNPPGEIPRLLAALEGVDAACGRRTARQDSWVKRVTSRIANTVRRTVLKDGLHDIGCSLRVIRRECMDGLGVRLFHGLHRFLPALLVLAGYRVREVPVSHRPRYRGRSHYSTLNRLLRPLVDLWAVAWMRRRWPRYQAQEVRPDSHEQCPPAKPHPAVSSSNPRTY